MLIWSQFPHILKRNSDISIAGLLGELEIYKKRSTHDRHSTNVSCKLYFIGLFLEGGRHVTEMKEPWRVGRFQGRG